MQVRNGAEGSKSPVKIGLRLNAARYEMQYGRGIFGSNFYQAQK
jgi:hypothetical protein